jgi:phage N-6-adenine-methyltransferase
MAKLKSNLAPLLSSEKMDWGTPTAVVADLSSQYGPFHLDAAASPHNAKASNFYALENGQDGLELPWFGTVFINPPYGRSTGSWIKKAYEETKNGVTSVILIPARTDTKYWHNYVMKASEVKIRHRFQAPQLFLDPASTLRSLKRGGFLNDR